MRGRWHLLLLLLTGVWWNRYGRPLHHRGCSLLLLLLLLTGKDVVILQLGTVHRGGHEIRLMAAQSTVLGRWLVMLCRLLKTGRSQHVVLVGRFWYVVHRRNHSAGVHCWWGLLVMLLLLLCRRQVDGIVALITSYTVRR